MSGLAFFFGLMFIVEVMLIMIYGVDYRLVGAPYIGSSWQLGPVIVPLRMLVLFVVALAMTACVYLYLSRTFGGRAILAVSQDRLALRLMGADPIKVKQVAFGLSIATAALAGALLIVIGPVEPSMNRLVYRPGVRDRGARRHGQHRRHAGRGADPWCGGKLRCDLLRPSWAPAVAFGILLLTLALRPQGLFGRY